MDDEEKPILEIYLKRTHKRPGSYVCGTVIPHMPRGKTLYVDKITISLIGRMQLGGEKPNHSTAVGDEDTVALFHLDTPLNDNHAVTLRNWRVSCFTFVLPEEPGMEEAKVRPRESHLREPEPKALPPSADLGNGNIISYSLNVAIRDETSGKNISATLPFTFSRIRASDLPKTDEQPIMRQQILMDRGRQMSIELAVYFPKSLIQGEAFPLTIRLLGEALKPVAKRALTLRLASCCLQLLEQTNLIIPPSNKTSYVKQHEIALRDASVSVDGLLPVISDQGLDLSEYLHHPAISRGLIPSFDCANISRSYGVKAFLKVRYDQTSSDLEFSFDGVTLWPYETYSMARAAEEEQRREDDFTYPDEDNWPL